LYGGPALRKTATYTQDNTNRINAHIDGIRTHDLSDGANEDDPRGQCDQQ
jgi:hypothetical protein